MKSFAHLENAQRRLFVLAADNDKKVCCQDSIYRSQFKSLIGIDRYVYGFASGQDKPTHGCVDRNSDTLRWTWQAKTRDGLGIAVDHRFILWGQHIASRPGKLIRVKSWKTPLRQLLGRPILALPLLHYARVCGVHTMKRDFPVLTCLVQKNGYAASRPTMRCDRHGLLSLSVTMTTDVCGYSEHVIMCFRGHRWMPHRSTPRHHPLHQIVANG